MPTKKLNSRACNVKKMQKNMVALWALKILLDLKGWKRLQGKYDGFTSNREILSVIGLEHLEDKKFSKKLFIQLLERQRKKYECLPAGPNKHLAENSKKLAEYLGLNEVERQMLLFTIITEGNENFHEVAEKLGELNAEEVVASLAVIMEVPEKEVRAALSRHGLLSRSGLLTVDRGSRQHIRYKMDLLDGLAEALHEPDTTVETMLQHYFIPAEKGELKAENYHHVEEHFTMIQNHLQQACRRKMQGVNILVYGPPGTGKTEFAKTVTEVLGSPLYEINIGEDDTPFNKPKRMRSFQLAQQVLARQKNALILFDEVDSLLAESFSFFLRDGDSLNLKAWINKNLEQNQVPAIWIANDIRFAESAYLRRFDIVFHLDTPPRSTRIEILDKYLQGIPVRPQWKEQLADNKNIAPAFIATAARVARCQKSRSPAVVEKTIERLLESTLSAMGYPRQPVIQPQSQISYRLGAVNPDHDLKGVIQGLKKQGEGRLCLYGPPGTGKTEFATYLAKQLDRPLLLKRGSDLLGPYVGETEANIAAMFHEAGYENAVLLLDEADSFLRDRSEARRSWEVTQVNELLTQMERYNGVFVCSTNLMDTLDTASLRRFDLKVKFDFLQPKQAWNLFKAVFQQRGVKLSRSKYWREKLKKYSLLTPGDFATVVRKSRISGQELCPESLLEGLAGEMAFKQTSSGRQIGFLPEQLSA